MNPCIKVGSVLQGKNKNINSQFLFSDLVSSYDPRKAYRFTSPWAAKLEDEEFFSRTLETVGSIIKDDVKLGTLYCILLLATPGQNLSQASLTNHWLHFSKKWDFWCSDIFQINLETANTHQTQQMLSSSKDKISFNKLSWNIFQVVGRFAYM